MKNKNYFAINILTLRKRADLKQHDMQDKLGVQRNTWSNWENEKAEPGIEMMCSIADFFKVDVGRLISENLAEFFESNSNILSEPEAPVIAVGCRECDLKDEIIISQKQTIKALEGQVDALNKNRKTVEASKK